MEDDLYSTAFLHRLKFLQIIGTNLFSEILNTVDYVDQTDGTIVFRTCEEEKDKVILQLGTCNAERALKVAKLV